MSHGEITTPIAWLPATALMTKPMAMARMSSITIFLNATL